MGYETICLGTKKELDEQCLKTYGVTFEEFWIKFRHEQRQTKNFSQTLNGNTLFKGEQNG